MVTGRPVSQDAPMFKRIVVGTDGSDTASAAVAQAVALGGRTGAEVLVIHAYPRTRRDRVTGAEESGSLLRDVQRQHGDVVSLRTLAREGNPADVLVKVAAEEGADLIVTGNRGMTGKRILGTVPDRVSHRSPCSVLVAHTRWAWMPEGEEIHEGRLPERVLIATDGSDTAAVAVAAGAGLARTLAAEAMLLHVGEPGHGRTVLQRAAQDIGDGLVLKTVTVEGDPTGRILEVAESARIELIVMGSRGMAGMRRVVLGGVPNRVVHQAPCSVLVVKTS